MKLPAPGKIKRAFNFLVAVYQVKFGVVRGLNVDQNRETLEGRMRYLICERCYTPRLPDGIRMVLTATPYEEAEWQRLTVGIAKQPLPQNRWMKVNDTVLPLPLEFFTCDSCNARIYPGDKAAGWSVWLESRQPPPAWEEEFIDVRRV